MGYIAALFPMRVSTGTVAHSPRSTVLGRVVLAGLGLACGLAVAELSVRVAGIAPEIVLVQEGRFRLSSNPRLGYEPVPHYDHHGGLDSFHDYVGRSNSLGFRDRERAVEKPPGVFRILVLGDSIAAGQAVREAADVFPARLEAGLAAAGVAAEVINFAVTGYDTRQEVALLEDRGLRFAPDLVLLAYCLNDTRQDDGGILAGLLARAPGTRSMAQGRVHPRLAASALYRLLWFWNTGPEHSPPSDEAGVAGAFDELGRLAGEHRFRVLVVVFPRFGGLLEEYRYADQHMLPAAAAERNGFFHLDLVPAFQACRRTGESRLARDRYHPTASGHACAAEAIRGYLLEQENSLETPAPSRLLTPRRDDRTPMVK